MTGTPEEYSAMVHQHLDELAESIIEKNATFGTTPRSQRFSQETPVDALSRAMDFALDGLLESPDAPHLQTFVEASLARSVAMRLAAGERAEVKSMMGSTEESKPKTTRKRKIKVETPPASFTKVETPPTTEPTVLESNQSFLSSETVEEPVLAGVGASSEALEPTKVTSGVLDLL